jgi:valyl-tRNA synthetase
VAGEARAVGASRSTPEFEMVLKLSGAQVDAMRTRLMKEIEQLEKVIASSRKQLSSEAFVSKAPAHVIDGIKSIEAKYPGLENFMIHWAEGLGPKEFKEQLRWFAKDVMPAFKK